MTLMPVSKISTLVDCSVKAGGCRWMGIDFLVLTGPSPSTGSPTTLRIRPRHSGPTGIAMGAPVSRASMPRTRPSEVSIATVRTVFSPRWRATSRVRLSLTLEMPGLETLRAFRILGSLPPSNSTSTTGPMTWTILPFPGVPAAGENEVVMGEGSSCGRSWNAARVYHDGGAFFNESEGMSGEEEGRRRGNLCSGGDGVSGGERELE
jgi:hypothetical protein